LLSAELVGFSPYKQFLEASLIVLAKGGKFNRLKGPGVKIGGRLFAVKCLKTKGLIKK